MDNGATWALPDRALPCAQLTASERFLRAALAVEATPQK